MPLIAALSEIERTKLVKQISAAPDAPDASAYRAAPPEPSEFGGEEETLAWDAGGWDQFA